MPPPATSLPIITRHCRESFQRFKPHPTTTADDPYPHYSVTTSYGCVHRSVASVRLAVGLGTFAPLSEENWKRKQLHRERFSMPSATASLLNNPQGRIIAVGTTTLRALESNLREHGRFQPGEFETSAFFHPPDTISSIQGLITNFHLPGSSLLMLVAAFSGTDRILPAYKKAIAERYRFYSYGDAMLVFA